MSGFRSYCDFAAQGGAREGADIVLSEDESRHLCGSLRAREGDSVDAFNLQGDVFECKISEVSSKRTRLTVVCRKAHGSPKTAVYLAQCMPKGKTFEEIIRQSVEIGAAGIIPLTSVRCEVKLDARDVSRKLEKWRSKVVEAVKQSANFSDFSVAEPSDVRQFLSRDGGRFDLKIVASLRAGTRPILDILKSTPSAVKSVCILVGPEGDLSADEYAAADASGFMPATLGDNVMKCETASLFALSVAKAFLQSEVRAL